MDSALPSIRHSMLSYLSPWLLNVELVNPHIPDSTFLPGHASGSAAPTDSSPLPPLLVTDRNEVTQARSLLKGVGWGSCQATEMVLNNLMYVTAKVRKTRQQHSLLEVGG